MTIQRIGVMTSGGDAPGMNPAVRAVVRMASSLGLEVMGVERGFQGLMESAFKRLTVRDIGGLLSRGGTILQSARSEEFKTITGQRKAIHNLNAAAIDGLVIIGGNGTHQGAYELSRHGFPIVTIPSTIDNDLCFTDMTLGVDTALNTVLDAIDKIRDTASSLKRAFLIETMGRDSGYLALMSGIAGGAEVIVIPEAPMTLAQILEGIQAQYTLGKPHSIIVVAEGHRPSTQEIYEYLHAREQELGFTVRMTILGHIQRGGRPTAYERLLATRLAVAAVQNLHAGNYGVMVGLVGNKTQLTDLAQVATCHKKVDLDLYAMANMLEFGRAKTIPTPLPTPTASRRANFGEMRPKTTKEELPPEAF
ncbi:MAG: 6-phosphofructokinase [Chloroflexi bacterium]|nr:6-phosphofructokinase [Chloroflexota bacterium]